MKALLAKVRESINAGYLPENWHESKEELLETGSGYYALSSECIETDDGVYYHEEHEADSFGYDDIDDVYRHIDDLVYARKGGRNNVHTHEDNCTYIDGDYIVKGYENECGYVCLHDGRWIDEDYAVYVEDEGDWYHIDQCYYWESDSEYHLEPESENTLWGYGDGPELDCYVQNDDEGGPKMGIGFEIEKSTMPDFDFDKQDVYKSTGCVMERDCSVENGFELKTPVYNLYSPKTEERLQAIRDFCDVNTDSTAGGHIGFSVEGMNDEQLLQAVRGFLPLIYAMWPTRVDGRWSKAKKNSDLARDRDKYQAIRLRGNYIEFRIFGAVRKWENLMFRLELFRIMGNNLGADFSYVIGQAITPNTPLNNLLTRDVYTGDKFITLITNSIKANQAFGEDKLTVKRFRHVSKYISLAKNKKQAA